MSTLSPEQPPDSFSGTPDLTADTVMPTHSQTLPFFHVFPAKSTYKAYCINPAYLSDTSKQRYFSNAGITGNDHIQPSPFPIYFRTLSDQFRLSISATYAINVLSSYSTHSTRSITSGNCSRNRQTAPTASFAAFSTG